MEEQKVLRLNFPKWRNSRSVLSSMKVTSDIRLFTLKIIKITIIFLKCSIDLQWLPYWTGQIKKFPTCRKVN